MPTSSPSREGKKVDLEYLFLEISCGFRPHRGSPPKGPIKALFNLPATNSSFASGKSKGNLSHSTRKLWVCCRAG